jgi:hypothetical protein
MGLGALPLTCFPSAGILAVTHRLKMGGVHTGRIAAEMVKLKVSWDRPDLKLVGEAMGIDQATGAV